jgi:regulator of replication initiation timing
MIDEMRHLNVYYVDAHFNILPDSHVDSVFLFGPSDCFIDYLNAQKIEYTEDEVQMDRNLIFDYIEKYTENFSDTDRFESIAKYDIFDLIQTLNRVLNGRYLSRFDYETKTHTLNMENTELTRKVEKLEEKLAKSEKERKEIINSKSWKITKPLRDITNRKQGKK